MRHLGDITKIRGDEAPVVDVIIGGSPCQDLSVAGKRAGLAGERSGLFMEQIRIIKEMRKRDELADRTAQYVRPRYMVWENVPGAFGSNGGKDFAAILEETVRVIEPEAPAVPVPEKGWPTSGCLMGEQWSVAWRVLDAQFWGVPQRRRRIALVADFGGLTAPEILFVRKSVSGDSEPGRPQRESAAGGIGERSSGAISFQERAGKPGGGGKGILIQPERTGALSTLNNQAVYAGFNYLQGAFEKPAVGFDGYNQVVTGKVAKTLNAVSSDADHVPLVAVESTGFDGYNEELTGDVSSTLGVNCGMSTGRNGVVYAIGNGQSNQSISEMCGALNCMHDQQMVFVPDIANTLKAKANLDHREVSETYIVAGLDCRNGRENGDLCRTLQSKPNGGFSYNYIHPVRVNHAVRRLTPLECERLQGFPDGWTDIGEWTDSKGKKHKEADTPRYKALGNSIAIPPWKWILKRLCACYERDATMASLFDGIGGFPYIWEQLNGKGSCVWASEIEEFPMAVTRLRFGGEDNE